MLHILPRTICCVFICCLTFGKTLAQEVFSFMNYSIEQGLAQSQVRTVYQDKKGYLWLGTLAGLSRYDGKNFINYTKENGLIDNCVYSITGDTSGNIWIGTKGGINYYNGKTFTAHRFKAELADNLVNCILQDNKGNLWIGTDGMGLCCFNGKTFTYYTSTNGLPDNNIRAVCADKEGNIWLGTKTGLCFYKDGKFKTVNTGTSQACNFSSIICDKDGHLWLSTFGQGVFEYNKGSFKNYSEKEGLIFDWVRSACEDGAGNIWFATKAGLSKFNGKTFENIDEENGLPYSNINTVFKDREGNIWLATEGKGVYSFKTNAFTRFVFNGGAENEMVTSVVEDKNHRLWFSTFGNGIYNYDGTAFEHYKNPGDNISATIWSSLKDTKNNLWFGSSTGILKYDGKKFTSFQTLDGLKVLNVYSICEDHAGNLWFGSAQGLSVYNGSSFKNYLSATNHTGKNVKAIVEDKNNMLWLAMDNGLYKFDGKIFKRYSSAEGLADNNVNCLAIDEQNNLWIGTNSGLNFFDGKTFSKVSTENKFNSNYITFMLFDNKGQLWLGTNNGMFVMNTGAYLKNKTSEFIHLSNYDGLPSPECNQNAAYKDHKGNLWLGTGKGIVKYTNAGTSLMSTSKEPDTHISGIKLFFEEQDWQKYQAAVNASSALPQNLSVDYKTNHFTFDYIGINLGNPQAVKYKYMLSGFDSNWSPATDATFATYSNLPYGKYTFQVIACNQHNAWNKVPAVFSFEIRAPFWASWWFITLCTALGLGLICAGYTWRLSGIKKRHYSQQLEFKSKLHTLEHQSLNASMSRHFIFNALNSIQYYMNNEDKLSANKYLTQFAKLIRMNLDCSLSELVPLSEEIERLELYLNIELMRFEKKFDYRISIDNDIDSESILIPPMLLQPYVENSILHGILPSGKSGTIEIKVQQGPGESILFSIEDNGIGIEASRIKKLNRIGMHISRGTEITSQRIKLLGNIMNMSISVKGPFDVKNELNITTGTKVELVLN